MLSGRLCAIHAAAVLAVAMLAAGCYPPANHSPTSQPDDAGVYAAAWLIASLAGADYATVKSTLANPIVALLLAMLIVSAAIHMRLGMQVIIEDYITRESTKIVLLLLNNFFAILVAAASVWAILKLSFA